MYALIKNLYNFVYSYGFKNKTKQDILSTEINISISTNIESEKIICKIDTDAGIIMTNNFSILKCEKIAYFLSLVCDNNKYITNLILYSIEEQKQISNQHLLFYDNILYFLKQYLYIKKNVISYNNDPLIKPLKAFKAYISEEKI